MYPCLLSGDGQILTRRSEGDNIHWFDLCPVDLCHVAELLAVRKPQFLNLQRERFDFRTPHRFNPVHRAGQLKTA